MTLELLYFIALIHLTVGVAMSLKPDSIKAGIDSFLKSPGMMFIVGVVSTLLGAMIVSWHNSWGSLTEIIVSIVGWGSLLKGFMILAFPKDLKTFVGKMYKTDTCIRIWGLVVLVLGAVLMALANGML